MRKNNTKINGVCHLEIPIFSNLHFNDSVVLQNVLGEVEHGGGASGRFRANRDAVTFA